MEEGDDAPTDRLLFFWEGVKEGKPSPTEDTTDGPTVFTAPNAIDIGRGTK